MMLRNVFLFIPFLIFSCTAKDEQKSSDEGKDSMERVVEEPLAQETTTIPIIQEMQTQHQVDLFKEKDVVAFDIILEFGGKKRLDGTVYTKTNSSKVLVVKEDSSTLLFDGTDVFVSPAASVYSSARFDALTWSYFFMAPFKMNDPGTNWKALGEKPLDEDTSLPAAKLTFDNGVGDAPDDWYIAYQNKDEKRLEALAYIVTFGGRNQEKAEASPHAIRYSDYRNINGIPFAHKWTFHNWSEEEGLEDQLGEAIITSITFPPVDSTLFQKRNDSEVVPL